jgi:hypothetical protein
MTRRWWLPYVAWALLVGAVVLVAQPGFSYCTELHPRLCAKALLGDLSPSAWDPAQGSLILLLLATGWAVIAAGRRLGINAGVGFAAWAMAVAVVMIFLVGGHGHGCLGPIGVTPEQCRASWGLPPETDWDRFSEGPGPFVAILLAGWLAIAQAVAWRRRQRGSL